MWRRLLAWLRRLVGPRPSAPTPAPEPAVTDVAPPPAPRRDPVSSALDLQILTDLVHSILRRDLHIPLDVEYEELTTLEGLVLGHADATAMHSGQCILSQPSGTARRDLEIAALLACSDIDVEDDMSGIGYDTYLGRLQAAHRSGHDGCPWQWWKSAGRPDPITLVPTVPAPPRTEEPEHVPETPSRGWVWPLDSIAGCPHGLGDPAWCALCRDPRPRHGRRPTPKKRWEGDLVVVGRSDHDGHYHREKKLQCAALVSRIGHVVLEPDRVPRGEAEAQGYRPCGVCRA